MSTSHALVAGYGEQRRLFAAGGALPLFHRGGAGVSGGRRGGRVLRFAGT